MRNESTRLYYRTHVCCKRTHVAYFFYFIIYHTLRLYGPFISFQCVSSFFIIYKAHIIKHIYIIQYAHPSYNVHSIMSMPTNQIVYCIISSFVFPDQLCIVYFSLSLSLPLPWVRNPTKSWEITTMPIYTWTAGYGLNRKSDRIIVLYSKRRRIA